MKAIHSIRPHGLSARSILSASSVCPDHRGGLGLLVALLLVSLCPAAPLGTAFTFQGRLTAGGVPANGAFDLRLTLFHSPTGAIRVDTVLTNQQVAVSNGLFTTVLDFGAGVFTGTPYWLEVAVRPGGSPGPFGGPLLPRQQILGAPYALFAANAGIADSASTAATATLAGTATTALTANSAPWAGLSGVPAGFADGVDDNTSYAAGAGLELSGAEFRVRFGASGASDTAARSDHVHGAEEIASGILSAARIDPLVTRDSEVMPIVLANDGAGSGLDAGLLDGRPATAFWQLGGNIGTTPGTDFLGTTDSRAFELRVNNACAFRLEPDARGPNVIAGASVNAVSNSVAGASIGGGAMNIVEADFAAIGGGRNNRVAATGSYAAIPGGFAARAFSFGQLVHASGSFAGPGDAQTSVYVLRGTNGPGATTTSLFLDESGEPMRVPPDGVWTFEVLVVGRARLPVNQVAGFHARGVVKRVGANMSLVGTSPLAATVIERDNPNWNVELVADDTEHALVIRVTGAVGQTIRWVATVRTAELIF